ncbi:MAG: TraB/GumN family protein [Burkholderiales bacterium]|nr:TraB/GumN family protein [Burkholderiales bacterium]
MKRRAFLSLATLLLAPAWAASPAHGRFSRGVLWRIEYRDKPPSHVFGTIHVADPRLATLPAPVSQAFDSARSLTLEFMADGYARERFLEAAMFLDAQTLDEKIGADDFERVLERLAPIGLSREFVRKLKPWGVLINLRNPRGAHASAGPTLEGQLFERARARRLALHTMENVEEQIFTFDEFPMDSQVALLRHALEHHAELVEMSDRTLEAYLARDLDGIWRVQQDFVRRHPRIAPHNAVFVKRVIYDRSVVMAFRMQRQLRAGAAFVALGALHLHGAKGVLSLLEQDGYRARRVY